jgi:serine/threonine protein kinase
LIREIKILTHPKLRLHPNIVQLFWYDLVEESDGKYTPALIMEKAVFGSLSDILDGHRSSMSSQSQRSLCLDVCSGLLALHKAFVAHGDVKSDNVLIFPSSTGSGEYTAKLADFGSIISLVKPAQGEYPRYHGTPITNAPEVSEQARRLDAAGLVLCDNYSLGLLIFQIATGDLNESITAKTPSVLDTALEMISQANHPNEFENALIRVLTHLLAYEPFRRCHDLSIIQNLLRPIQGEDLTFERYYSFSQSQIVLQLLMRIQSSNPI